MSEPVCKCEHPKMFYSKHNKKEIFVSCGKCLACRKARQTRWVVKLQNESKCHLYTQVMLLEYNDHSIPMYDYSDDPYFIEDNTPRLKEYYKKNPELKKIDLRDIKFKDDAEYDYIIGRLNGSVTSLPHASVFDIQIFKKRLNTKIKREITGEYGSFRSAIVAEYGSTTFRPHYHCIFFFDDERIVQKLPQFVRDCWKDQDGNSLGFAKVEPDHGHFASYISKYITKPADIPEIYEYPGFKTFFLTSRHPPLGSLCTGAQNRTIFDMCTPKKVEFIREGNQVVPKVFPIGTDLENRIFPKCPLYSKVSVPDRFFLYHLAFDADGLFYESYEAFLNTLLRSSLIVTQNTLFNFAEFENRLQCLKVDIDQGHLIWKRDNKSVLVRELCGDYTTENSFHVLYSVCNRIRLQKIKFNVSYGDYVRQIFRYYDYCKPQSQLKDWYRQMHDKLIDDPEYDLRFFYPLSFYRAGWHPEESDDSVQWIKDLKQKYFDSTKTHRKNAYFESRRLKEYDYNLYLTIKNYYYAKKCDEAIKAIA